MTALATFSLALANETATANLMADLALLIGPGDVITLSGDLGAGKTAAARALIRYLAGDDSIEVPSPTFTLVHEYRGPRANLYHIDLYRIDTPRQLETLGLDDLRSDNSILLIEWGEKFPRLVRERDVEIALEREGEHNRRITVRG